MFSNLKRWALGTFHGLRRPQLRRYLDEFVFRWNRRRHTATALDTLLGIGTRLQPAGYRDIFKQRALIPPSRPTPPPHSRLPRSGHQYPPYCPPHSTRSPGPPRPEDRARNLERPLNIWVLYTLLDTTE